MSRTLTHTEKKTIAQRLDVPLETVNRLCQLSRRLSHVALLQCNGPDGPYRNESPDEFCKRQNRTVRLAEKSEEKLAKITTQIAEKAGLYFYHQTDPRGVAVYVSRTPIPENNYSTQAIALY